MVSLSRCKEEERKSFFLWDAFRPGRLDFTGGASQSCEGRSSPRKPPYLADALCSGTQGKAVVQISTATMLLCNKRPLLQREGEGGLAAVTAWCLQLGAGGQARPAAVQWPLAARRHCGHGRKEEGQSFGATAQKRARREGDARGSVAGLRNTERSSPLRFPS